MTKRKESGVDLPVGSKETSKKKSQHRDLEFPIAKSITLRGVSFPFRPKGDPRAVGVETDNSELFEDYAREQWMGIVVKKGMYLFDKYVMPDYAFIVLDVQPENAVIGFGTKIALDSDTQSYSMIGRKVMLEEIVGHDSVKKKCKLIMSYLTNPAAFGEWAPHAVLFHGPPGTGKTMMARALASEANASIFLTKASDLIGVHVGDGGRRISALFEDARKKSPSIVFIDELDAIGLTRSFQSIRGDVSEVVTALLSELDRSNDESGIVVIGATNAEHMIDSAIRSRFDTLFEFPLPDKDERRKILEMYSARLPIPLLADIDSIVALTDGFSGRDLRDRVLKEALHTAISEGVKEIDESIISDILKDRGKKKSLDYMV